jgi:hypothetical protein
LGELFSKVDSKVLVCCNCSINRFSVFNTALSCSSGLFAEVLSESALIMSSVLSSFGVNAIFFKEGSLTISGSTAAFCFVTVGVLVTLIFFLTLRYLRAF